LESPIGLGDLRDILSSDRRSHVVLWGDGLATEFAFQAMQLGVRGILPSSATVDCLLDSLANINRGVLCFDKDLMDYLLSQKRVTLTERQGQLVSLVAQGLKNKEIAWRLGTTEGTVKAYLYKLFRKLGVNDRLGIVLYGQKNLFDGQLELQRTGNSGSRLRRPPEPFVPRSLPLQSGERATLQAVS
jgi:DNA-binding NarL/FixJ family response regulator